MNLHNRERAYVGIADLSWDSGLEASAQDWAEYLAVNNQFRHSGQPVGENLASASNRSNVVTYMFNSWANEKVHFSNAKPFPDVSVDGGWVGHYTQLIWGATYEVGCGVAYQSGVNYLVCQYRLDGNYNGNCVVYPDDVIRTPTGHIETCDPDSNDSGSNSGGSDNGSGSGSNGGDYPGKIDRRPGH